MNLVNVLLFKSLKALARKKTFQVVYISLFNEFVECTISPIIEDTVMLSRHSEHAM